MIAFNKSGIATKTGLLVGACIIDCDYQGEIHLHVVNTSSHVAHIKSGEKLVQFMVVKYEHVDFEEVKNEELFLHATNRGVGGFGSTGV